MSNVIHRTNRIKYKLERRFQVHTPAYSPPSSADWIVNPDLTALEGILDEIYWKIVGETVVAMDAGEQASVDLTIADAQDADTTSRLNAGIMKDPVRDATLSQVGWSVSVSGLTVTLNLESLVTDVQKSITAHASSKKFALGILVFNTTSSEYDLVLLEKTTGSYTSLASDEQFIAMIGEWSVVANGTVLTESTFGVRQANKNIHSRYIMTTANAVVAVSIADAEVTVTDTAWETIGTVTLDVARYAEPGDVKVEALGMLKTDSGDADIRIAYFDGTSSGAFGVSNYTNAGAMAITAYNKAPANIPGIPTEYRLQARVVGATSVTLRGWSLSFLRKEE
jgi:hypothetical protein